MKVIKVLVATVVLTATAAALEGISPIQRVSRDQANNGNEVKYSGLQPGDLMFFSIPENGVVTHVGMYIGGGQFIGSETSGVKIVTLSDYWASCFVIGGAAIKASPVPVYINS